MSFEIKDVLYIATVIVGALAAVFSDRWQNRQNQKDIEEIKKTMVSKNDYEKEVLRIEGVDELQWQKIDQCQKWEATHEKESWSARSVLELKIAELHGKNERFESMFATIEKKLDAIMEWQEKQQNERS